MEASLYLFFILYGGPSDLFFVYYIGAPRSLSSLTIWGPSDQFLLIQYGGPSQISFIVYYMGPSPFRSVSLHAIGGPPHIIVTFRFFFKKYMGAPSDQFLRLYGVSSDQFLCILFGDPSQISFFSYYMGPLSDQFFLLLYGAPSDQFLHILYGGGGGGGPQISFFAYYMGVPSDQFLRLLYGGPIRLVSMHTI